LESVVGGAETMQDAEDKKWNTLNDVQIMMAALLIKKFGLLVSYY
jgi:hypothetical protein